LSGGKILVDLEAKHGFEIGNFAFRNSHFILAVEWLEFCKKKAQDGDITISHSKIDHYLNRIVEAVTFNFNL
jgi:hypothetical protein